MTALATTFCWMLSSFGQTSLQGHWEGRATQKGEEFAFMVDFEITNEETKGKFFAPAIGAAGTPLVNIKYAAPKVHFEMIPGSGGFPFDGEVAGDTMSGVWLVMGTPAKFTLQRVPAAPPRYKEEEVRFQNGNITLAGTLLLPVGKGPHPAVVFIHGSGPETRAASRFLADHFARRGIASLIYDKRGTGASTGNWESAGFGDLADDALAAVQFLKSRTEINHRQIGLRGQSQGGWIAPLTASRSSDVAFIIIVSGPTVPPWQQETYKVQARTRAMGLPESEVVEAVGLMKLKFEVASTGKGWEQLAAAWEKARGKKWYPLTNPLNTLAALQEVWRREFAFDPVPVLETVTCPLLGIYGESDSNVQTKESAAILEKALGKAGNKDFTIKIFPKADHAILVWPDPKGQSHWLRFADGYIETMTEWLLKHAKASK